MAKSKGFNGHKNWNHWNVSLWINNDEGLYRLAMNCIASTNNRDEAAERMLSPCMLMSERDDGKIVFTNVETWYQLVVEK